MLSAPAEVSAFLPLLLLRCLDIRAVWSMGRGVATHELLAFADGRTLECLRRSDELHRVDIELFVVFDGEQFENAWGPRRIRGSLSRWAWREAESGVAYYDESRWAGAGGGSVVRVRRNARLIWSRTGC